MDQSALLPKASAMTMTYALRPIPGYISFEVRFPDTHPDSYGLSKEEEEVAQAALFEYLLFFYEKEELPAQEPVHLSTFYKKREGQHVLKTMISRFIKRKDQDISLIDGTSYLQDSKEVLVQAQSTLGPDTAPHPWNMHRAYLHTLLYLADRVGDEIVLRFANRVDVVDGGESILANVRASLQSLLKDLESPDDLLLAPMEPCETLFPLK